MSTDRRKRVMVAALGVLSLVLPAHVCGQNAADGTAAATGAGPAAKSVSANRAARELIRLAAIDLQVTGGTNPRDFRIAAMLGEIAHKLSPEDEVLLRLLIDATSVGGDRETLMRLTEELVRLQPGDTVAQLRAISGAVSSRQDIDSRLAGYEAFLAYKGKNGQPLDASIRSRLALDAALLLRERGDIRGFAEKLSLATELDSTNKDAASLAVTFFSEQSSDAVGRLTLLISLLKADPFDPETHLAIARELTAGEAYRQASRFYTTYSALMASYGEKVPVNVEAETNTLFWSSRGADALVRKLRELVEADRSAAEQGRRYAIAMDQPLDQAPDPDRVRLRPELERVRLAAALASGEKGQSDYAYEEMVKTFDQQIEEAAAGRVNLPAGVTAEEMLEREKRLQGELMSMRLWAGRDLDAAETTLGELERDETIAGAPGAGPVLQRLRGWLQLQRGDLDAAETTLKAIAGSDVVARLGLAVIDERRERREEAVKAYAALAREAGGSIAGAYARTRHEVLSGAPLGLLPVSSELEGLAAAVPGWLEGMITDPRRIVSLQGTLEPTRIGAMEPARLRLRVRNVSPLPLAVGADKPVNSRILLAPEMSVEARRWPNAHLLSVVVRLDRKLRLLPQEEIDVVVWADQGLMGWTMNKVITVPSTVKWKIVQGFVMHPEGYYVPGPHCLSSETDHLQRAPSFKMMDDPTTLVRWVQTGTSEDVAEVLMLAMVNAPVPADSPGAWRAEEREMISRALAARYSSLDSAARVMVATLTPLPRQAPWLKELEAALTADADRDVRLVTLALRVNDLKDPRIAAAETSGDEKLKLMGTLVRDRLAHGTPSYAAQQGRQEIGEPAETPPFVPTETATPPDGGSSSAAPGAGGTR